MKRKLFSVMLSVFAMLLLLGAAANPDSAAAPLAEEESAVLDETALETEAQLPGEETETPEQEDEDTKETLPVEETPVVDPTLLINGQPAPLELNKELQNGTTYVALSVLARQLEPDAQVSWNGSTATATVTTDKLNLTAKVGQLYIVANGRYLYVPEKVQLTKAGRVIVPLRVAAKAFDAQVDYDKATKITTVTSGSGAILSGDQFYNQDDLFWLSRVIYRESGNEPFVGQIAVGNVVLNRVADPAFPNTVEGVLAQKNQFTTYASGALRKTEPSQSSIIAAKLALDGGEVEETKGALFFDCRSNSWAARNKRHIATLGGHKFYG